jgi:hypothetical protein
MALSRLHASLVWGRCLAVPLLLSVVLACNQKTQEGAYRTAIPMAKSVRRATYRFHPARMFGPHHRVE